MNIKTGSGYTGSTKRITFILESLSYFIPEFNNINWVVDGSRAWSKGYYISDCLFYVKIITPEVIFEYNQTTGILLHGISQWKHVLFLAQECIDGYYNQFTIEQAKSFLSLNQ